MKHGCYYNPANKIILFGNAKYTKPSHPGHTTRLISYERVHMVDGCYYKPATKIILFGNAKYT